MTLYLGRVIDMLTVEVQSRGILRSLKSGSTDTLWSSSRSLNFCP